MSRALSRDRMADSGLGKTMSSVDRMVRGRSRSEERASMLPSTYNPLAPHFTVRSDPVIDRNNCQNNFAYQNKRNDYSHEQTSVRSGIPPSRSRIFSRTSHTSVDDINCQRNDKQKYREQAVDYLKDQDVNVKLQTPPLNSKRLLPTRHRTKNVILTILDNGEVCLEFIKRKNNNMVMFYYFYLIFVFVIYLFINYNENYTENRNGLVKFVGYQVMACKLFYTNYENPEKLMINHLHYLFMALIFIHMKIYLLGITGNTFMLQDLLTSLKQKHLK